MVTTRRACDQILDGAQVRVVVEALVVGLPDYQLVIRGFLHAFSFLFCRHITLLAGRGFVSEEATASGQGIRVLRLSHVNATHAGQETASKH